MVYTQGHHMMAFIDEQYGRTKRVGWLRAMSNGATMDEASREALGLPWDELNNAWRAALPAAEVEPKPEAGEQKEEGGKQ